MADKLRKLILMLSSEHDGEVVAAARAIGKALKAAKKDWHWLVRKLDHAPEPEPEEEEEPEPVRPRPPYEAAQAWADWLPLTPADVQELHYCNLHAARGGLSGKQKIFIKEMAARYGSYGKETRITGAQRTYLHNIYEKMTVGSWT